ncbi:aminotransferase-like domain-containing protein [Aspergillus saccharolyticus JOP 1030-1]|uniref:Aromatic amino acid aminotransferase n=1 Tax=Aspergillus saccharolyticus JOP 1030-1 TaxID=1450539 RepID=A0A318ZDQ0_9EURO|nr:aromatic amino acid aminotransferase [Aspergillus saccharolyticus JOP 1030-1]PYH45641.1 aromatic amino acid aminotransferase [Aspergillus saccharolyticus JOP 1030-1]
MVVINLSRGWPNPALLPTAALATASATVLASPPIWQPALQYGPDEGFQPLREHVAHWLTEFYQPRSPISADRICITGGASQNLACILQVFSDPLYTRNVWMVAPTYHLAGRIFDDAGFAGRLRAVPHDAAGLDLAYLRQELVAAENKALHERNMTPEYKPARPWRKIYKHVIYATPTFSNPSTLTLSLSDREQLVRLAREFDALIITDDVYDFLQWSADPAALESPLEHAQLPRLVDIDGYLDGGPSDEWGNAISNGSFSKLIGAGMRTGWAEGTKSLAYGLSQTGSSRSGGAPSQFSASMVAQLFPTRVLHNHIAHVLQPAYAARYRRMMSAIREHLVPVGVTPTSSEGIVGGYFIWLKMPASLGATELATLALQEHEVEVAAGNMFRVQGDPVTEKNDFDDGMRLCIAWEDEDNLEEGVRRLGCAIRQALQNR